MQFTGLYVKLARGAEGGFYKPIAREISQRISVLSDERLLDIGTGPGDLVFEILCLHPNLHICAVDKSEKFIQTAKTYYNDIDFKVADAKALPYKMESFDFVVSTGLLHALKDPVAAITEWLRVLKTGGELWIYDPAVLILPKEIDCPALLKARLSLSLKDYWLLKFLMRFGREIPPRTMAIDKVCAICDAVNCSNNIRRLSVSRVSREEVEYIKIEIIK